MAELTPLGNLLKRAREGTLNPLTGRAYTQGQLGKAVGLTREGIGAVERGETLTLKPRTAKRLAEVLGVPEEQWYQAMGVQMAGGASTPLEGELLQIFRLVPADLQPALVNLVRDTSRRLVELPAPQKPRRVG